MKLILDYQNMLSKHFEHIFLCLSSTNLQLQHETEKNEDQVLN